MAHGRWKLCVTFFLATLPSRFFPNLDQRNGGLPPKSLWYKS